jgi:fused signal recognition particle receptor
MQSLIDLSSGMDIFGVASVAIMLLVSAKNIVSKAPESRPTEITKPAKTEEAKPAQTAETPVVKEEKPEAKKPEKPKVGWAQRLRKGLAQSRSEVWGKISNLIGGGLSSDVIEEIEELLYSADIGPSTVNELIEILESKKDSGEINGENFREFIYKFLNEKITPFQKDVDQSVYDFSKKEEGTKTIMIVGVNGVGKTTTIGKLATRLTRQGAKVVVGAGDTFRAAAVDQLQVWCERSGAEMIRAEEGANPSGVAFDAVKSAVENKADYCLVDTAGRLHTNSNLMQELVKIKNVMSKNDESAPQHVWLVLDAITGQNALRQAKEFNEALNLTGVIFTKCDGSSKAGSAIQIVQELKVPIIYIGVGEDVDDLDQFQTDQYLKALLFDEKMQGDASTESMQPAQV